MASDQDKVVELRPDGGRLQGRLLGPGLLEIAHGDTVVVWDVVATWDAGRPVCTRFVRLATGETRVLE